MNSNIIGSIVFILFGTATLLVLPEQVQIMETSQFNAQTFPRWVTFAMIGAAVLALGIECFQWVRSQSRVRVHFKWRHESNAFTYLLVLVLFATAIPFVGFVFASIGFTIASLVFFGSRKPAYYVFIIAFCVLVNYVFSDLLLVQLP